MADGDHIRVRVAQTSPQDWKYISEGGSTIVFSYAGPPHPTFDGTALRLRKIAHEDVSAKDKAPLTDGAGEEEPDDPTIVFQQTVIQRLISPEYLPYLHSVDIEREWLIRLAVQCETYRPAERCVRGRIDVSRRKGVLAPDLISGDGWAVEIKPKWGFLPSPTYLSTTSYPIKTKTCHFCMHAQLKKAMGQHTALGYCPLDLFSGVEARIVRALRALWDAWIETSGRVNNLRIFVEGHMLKPTFDPCSLGSLEPLARQLYPRPAFESMSLPSLDVTDLRDRFITALLPTLLQTPVLNTLASIQRTLDPLDIEGLAALWARAHAAEPTAPPPLGSGAVDPTPEEWAHFVDSYHAMNLSHDSASTQPQVDKLRYYCLAYLLSASFKDCSLILRMPPSRGPRAGVTVIDLDVKSIVRLGKWEQMDREIVRSYAMAEAPRRCIDQWNVDVQEGRRAKLLLFSS